MLPVVATGHKQLSLVHAGRGPRPSVCEAMKCLPSVFIGAESFDHIIVGLSVAVSSSDRVDVSVVDDSGNTGASVPHVGTAPPLVLLGDVALDRGVVYGSVLATDDVELPVHCTGTCTGAGSVHVGETGPCVGFWVVLFNRLVAVGGVFTTNGI